MKAWKIGGALALGLATQLAAALADLPTKAQDGAVWLNSYETGRMVARQQGKPLFVVLR